METKRSYYEEEFEPMCKWQKDERQYILEVHLEGFKKDQLKIRLSSCGFLTITGKRPVDETKSEEFNKKVNVPKDCRKEGIHARMSSGILTITMPKKIKEGHGNTGVGFQEPPKDQPATGTGIVTLNRIKARRCMTALKDSILRNDKGGQIARRLGVAIGVVVAVTVGGYLAYKIRQSFHF